MIDNKEIGTVFSPPQQEDFKFLIELYEAGKLAPVLDKTYPLRETAEALRYYGEGNARGKIVITMQEEGI